MIFNFIDLQQELSLRNNLLTKVQAALVEQPALRDELRGKIDKTENEILHLTSIKAKLTLLLGNFEIIFIKNFEINNPIASRPVIQQEYIKAISIYISQFSKYPLKFRLKLFKMILNTMRPQIDFNKYCINQVLYGEKYLLESLNQGINLCTDIIDNLALLDILNEIEFLTPLVIDPSGLFTKALKKKYENELIITWNLDETTLEDALISGKILTVVDFDARAIKLFEPLILWKYNNLINKIYQRHNTIGTKKRKVSNEIDEESSDSDANSDQFEIKKMEEQIEFLGKTIKINSNFRLILLLHNRRLQLSKSFLEKIQIIHSDINTEEVWKEVCMDVLLNTCYSSEKIGIIERYSNNNLNNDANTKFNELTKRCSYIDFGIIFDLNILQDLISICKDLNEKYEIAQDKVKKNPEYENNLQDEQISGISDLKSEDNLDKPSSDVDTSKAPLTNSSLNKNEHIKEDSINNGGISFFATDVVNPRSMPKVSNLERRNMPDYHSMCTIFSGLNEIIFKHNKIINYLYTLRITIIDSRYNTGNLYTFSESSYLQNILQAIEITIFNANFKSTSKSNEEVSIFLTMFVISIIAH